MCDLNYRRRRIDERLDATVERLAITMVKLITNSNGSVTIKSLCHVFNSMKFSDGEYDDFSSDIEEEKYVEYESENENEFEDDSEPNFDIYPLEEEEFVYGEMGTVIIDEPLFDVYTLKDEFVSGVEEMGIDDEPIFDTFPLEEEFVSRDNETVIEDEPIFDMYPSDEEFDSGNRETVIVDEPVFDTYLLEENFVTGDVGDVNYKNKKILDETYGHQITEVIVQEKVSQEDLIFTKDGVILIVHTDCSMQDEKVLDEKSISMMIDGDSSIHNEVLTGPISAWWESTFCIGFIRLVFDSGGINRKFEGEFCPPWRE